MSDLKSSAIPARKPLNASDVDVEQGSGYPQAFAAQIGPSTWRALGGAFGLTQFGVNLETLLPGSQSALRHWHTLSDEFVYVLSGTLQLITDHGEFVMQAGMHMGFKAGEKNAHHLVNRSSADAVFLVIGSRVAGDAAFYPDNDFAWFHTESGRPKVHKDGSPYL